MTRYIAHFEVSVHPKLDVKKCNLSEDLAFDDDDDMAACTVPRPYFSCLLEENIRVMHLSMFSRVC